jgi:hypothetical protein
MSRSPNAAFAAGAVALGAVVLFGPEGGGT